jgi:hypothetical protein
MSKHVNHKVENITPIQRDQFQAALEKRMNELDDDGWECEAHVYPYQGGGTLGAVIVAKKLNTSP